jgi:hypothetical protein
VGHLRGVIVVDRARHWGMTGGGNHMHRSYLCGSSAETAVHGKLHIGVFTGVIRTCDARAECSIQKTTPLVRAYRHDQVNRPNNLEYLWQ